MDCKARGEHRTQHLDSNGQTIERNNDAMTTDTTTLPPKTLREASCADDYDPNSMRVAKARELIRTFLAPVTAASSASTSAMRWAACSPTDIVSPIAVPGHDNSAMDGYAVRFADLKTDGETVLRRVGTSFAGKPWTGSVATGNACASLPAA